MLAVCASGNIDLYNALTNRCDCNIAGGSLKGKEILPVGNFSLFGIRQNL